MMTLFSFYTLPSTVMNHPTHSSIKVKSHFFSNMVKLQFLSCRRPTHSTTCPPQHLGLIWWEMLWWANKQSNKLVWVGRLGFIIHILALPPMHSLPACPFHLIQGACQKRELWCLQRTGPHGKQVWWLTVYFCICLNWSLIRPFSVNFWRSWSLALAMGTCSKYFFNFLLLLCLCNVGNVTI